MTEPFSRTESVLKHQQKAREIEFLSSEFLNHCEHILWCFMPLSINSAKNIFPIFQIEQNNEIIFFISLRIDNNSHTVRVMTLIWSLNTEKSDHFNKMRLYIQHNE